MTTLLLLSNILQMSKILEIKNEINEALDFIQAKRVVWRDRLVKYVDQDKDEDKIGVNTIYSMMQLGLSIKYSDETSVIILPRKFWDIEYAANLTSLAEFDFDETERRVLKYQLDWDQQFFWASVEKKRGWDSVTQTCMTSSEDPLSWLMDPYGDYLTEFRYHYFEVEMLKSDMTEDKWFDEAKVAGLTQENIEELESTKTYKNRAAWFNDVTVDESEDFYVSLYDWVRRDWNDLYMVTVDAGKNEILREVLIEPVTVEEKKANRVDMRTQVNITWFSPKRWDPVGVSLVDLVIDKQIWNSILTNLRLIDAKFSTFGQTNLVNTDIVKNTTDLMSPSTNTKWIGVNPKGWNISNAVYPVPRQSIMQDSYAVTNELNKQASLDTWISDDSLGIPTKNITLGQAQQDQANANLRLALGISVSNWWEKAYWNFMWLRSYYEYFEESEVKFARVANGFDSLPIEFRVDDFLWIESPNIKIESKKNAEDKRKKESASFMVMYPSITEDPTLPKVTKNIARRYAMRLQWTPREMIKLLTYDKDEESAKHKLNLINNNDDKWVIIDDLWEDHQTFLVIFEWALDGPVKDKAIQARKEAFILSGQMAEQNAVSLEQETSGTWRDMQRQMTSNFISQENKKPTESLENIAV